MELLLKLKENVKQDAKDMKKSAEKKVEEVKKQAIVDLDPAKELEKNKPKNKQPLQNQKKSTAKEASQVSRGG